MVQQVLVLPISQVLFNKIQLVKTSASKVMKEKEVWSTMQVETNERKKLRKGIKKVRSVMIHSLSPPHFLQKVEFFIPLEALKVHNVC